MTAAVAVTRIRMYTVRLKHDAGTVTLTVPADRAWKAVASVLKAEGAPLRAVQWVRVLPTCDYCEGNAVVYDRQSSDGTPLCKVCAKSEYPLHADRRTNTGELGVTRLTPVDRAEWENPAMSGTAVPV